MMEWQPIETAPRSGEEILVAYGRQGFIKNLVWFDKLHGCWVNKGMPELGLDQNATHWAPLPEPPAIAARADGIEEAAKKFDHWIPANGSDNVSATIRALKEKRP